MTHVTLQNVSKEWSGARAVEAVSFRVASGAFCALLGPSGCGKSTTLRLIAGLEEPSDGAIFIGERDVTGAAPSQRGVSMVFQNYALFPHLTVAENIVFGMEVRGTPRAERDARLKRAADILKLSSLLDRKPSQLSGGQQQRVALGRAIVAEAPVCLMDEPLSNLDAQLRVEMRREIRELQQRLSMTMIYVTHDQVEAMTMADQVVLMNAGHIEQDATPDQLYENPASAFAARFVGMPPMNVLPFAAIAAHVGGAGLATPTGIDPTRSSLGLRPEKARLSESGLPAIVTTVEFLGADTLIEARIEQHSFTVRLPGKVAASTGDRIFIAASQEDAHWFDTATGRKIARG